MPTRLLVPRRSEHRRMVTTVTPAIEHLQRTLDVVTPERRISRRFPIKLHAELHVGQKCIIGTTVNISSGGLLMTCSPDELKTRRRVRVRLPDWPSAPQGGKMTLILNGSIVRIAHGLVAVQRVSYEFVHE
jgi:hypothetical protein